MIKYEVRRGTETGAEMAMRSGVKGGLCSFKCLERVKDYSTARDDVRGPHASSIVGFSLKLDLFFL